MEFKFKFKYVEKKVTSKRTALIKKDGEYTVIVDEHHDELPVAISATTSRDDVDLTVSYYSFQGKLWTAVRTMHCVPSPYTSGGTDWAYGVPPEEIDLTHADGGGSASAARQAGLGDYLHSSNASYDETIVALEQWAKDSLIVQGYFMREAQEPCYVVQTFGLGNDHGGTGVFVQDYFNGNINPNCYFPITHLKEAQEEAKRIAAIREDKVNITLTTDPSIRVRRPDAIKFSVGESAIAQGRDWITSLEGKRALAYERLQEIESELTHERERHSKLVERCNNLAVVH